MAATKALSSTGPMQLSARKMGNLIIRLLHVTVSTSLYLSEAAPVANVPVYVNSPLDFKLAPFLRQRDINCRFLMSVADLVFLIAVIKWY